MALPVDEQVYVTIEYLSAIAEFEFIKVWDKTDDVVYDVYPVGEVPRIPLMHEIQLIVKVKNVGGTAAYLFSKVYDDDTNEWLDTVESVPYPVAPGESWYDYLTPGRMPARDWHLRVEAGHEY